MKRVIVALMSLAAIGPARAQPATVSGTAALSCRTTPDFVVVARNLPDEFGMELHARRRAGPDEAMPCAFAPKDGEFRLGGPEKPYVVEGMNGRFLAVTELIGVAGTLHVYDLSTGKAVVSEPLTEANQTKTAGNRVSFTARSGPGTAKTCPGLAAFKKQGGSGEIGVPSSVDLATGALTRNAKTVCTYAQ
ncbi:hypothetical protein [Methylobacterium sp. J-068]|uniref:hypothetical protein n=1 Tax=Methylobacterium sp. J-068 TaxID=2836649 RepID=UPI001FB8E1D9|nr:hypothetical protein [Methylobacterium sp. J-068]MCJ2034917.1 hypothetical protein [Methylobacterium sp. J-068]